jgi:hypothetical protein
MKRFFHTFDFNIFANLDNKFEKYYGNAHQKLRGHATKDNLSKHIKIPT